MVWMAGSATGKKADRELVSVAGRRELTKPARLEKIEVHDVP